MPRWITPLFKLIAAKREPPLLAIWLLCAGSFLIFAKVTGEVIEGDARQVDLLIVMALRSTADPSVPLGPLWLREVARDLTALGSPVVLALVVAGTVASLLLARRRRAALLVFASIAGGHALTLALKSVFDRARPDFALADPSVVTASFPSGHAAIAALTYLTLAALVAGIPPSVALRLYAMATGMLLTLLVGLSRVYLGVHWPTDVAAGWALGAAWGLLCWAVARQLRWIEAKP